MRSILFHISPYSYETVFLEGRSYIQPPQNIHNPRICHINNPTIKRRETSHRRHNQTSQGVLSSDSDFYNSLSCFRNRTAYPTPLHHRKRRHHHPTRHNNQPPLLHNDSGKNPSRHASRKNGKVAHHPSRHHRPKHKPTSLLPRPRPCMVLPHTHLPRHHHGSLRPHSPRHNTRPSTP